MNDFMKLTGIKNGKTVCVRKTDIVMVREDMYTGRYEGEEYEKSCTIVYLSEDRENWIKVQESADKIMEMIKDE